MRVIRTLAVAAFTAGVAVSAAVPATASPQQAQTTDARTAGRGVLICERDTANRRAFAREYGASPVFITAREALSVRPSEPAWSAPRCMTEDEHAKLQAAVAANARVPSPPRS